MRLVSLVCIGRGTPAAVLDHHQTSTLPEIRLSHFSVMASIFRLVPASCHKLLAGANDQVGFSSHQLIAGGRFFPALPAAGSIIKVEHNPDILLPGKIDQMQHGFARRRLGQGSSRNEHSFCRSDKTGINLTRLEQQVSGPFPIEERTAVFR